MSEAQHRPKWAADDEDERMNAIARNGGDGEHYGSGFCPVCGGSGGGHYNTCSTLPESDQAGKQQRYQDAKGDDWIDECARTFTAEEFRGAMRFTIGKYNRRMGKKDELVKEIEKMRDYCQRWLDVELSR